MRRFIQATKLHGGLIVPSYGSKVSISSELLNDWQQWIPREQVSLLDTGKIQFSYAKESTLKSPSFHPPRWFPRICFPINFSFKLKLWFPPTLQIVRGTALWNFDELSQILNERQSLNRSNHQEGFLENSYTLNNTHLCNCWNLVEL